MTYAAITQWMDTKERDKFDRALFANPPVRKREHRRVVNPNQGVELVPLMGWFALEQDGG